MSEKNIDYLSQNAFSKLASQKKYQIVTCLDNFVGDLENTCFMNSVLQALVNIPELNLYFLSKQYDKDKKVSDGMADAYRDLLLNINDPKARYENLVKINRAFAKVCKNYEICSQYDANSFLSYFLSCVSKEANDPKFNKDDLKILREKLDKESDFDKKIELRKQISESEINLFLLRLLYFYRLDTQCCSECNSYFLSYATKSSYLIGDFESLDNMFKDLSQDKLIAGGKDKQFCKTCNKEVPVNYRTRIYGAPNYLFVRREKGGNHDKFSFKADDFSIGEFAAKKEDQDVKYELISVVCRDGDSAKRGHCYSYCYKFNNVWYYFSDNILKKMPDDYKIDQDENIQKNFFLGVYRKKDMRDKDLFEGYDINDFVHDEEDLKIISECSKNNISYDHGKNNFNDNSKEEIVMAQENIDSIKSLDGLKKYFDNAINKNIRLSENDFISLLKHVSELKIKLDFDDVHKLCLLAPDYFSFMFNHEKIIITDALETGDYTPKDNNNIIKNCKDKMLEMQSYFNSICSFCEQDKNFGVKEFLSKLDKNKLDVAHVKMLIFLLGQQKDGSEIDNDFIDRLPDGLDDEFVLFLSFFVNLDYVLKDNLFKTEVTLGAVNNAKTLASIMFSHEKMFEEFAFKGDPNIDKVKFDSYKKIINDLFKRLKGEVPAYLNRLGMDKSYTIDSSNIDDFLEHFVFFSAENLLDFAHAIDGSNEKFITQKHIDKIINDIFEYNWYVNDSGEEKIGIHNMNFEDIANICKYCQNGAINKKTAEKLFKFVDFTKDLTKENEKIILDALDDSSKEVFEFKKKITKIFNKIKVGNSFLEMDNQFDNFINLWDNLEEVGIKLDTQENFSESIRQIALKKNDIMSRDKFNYYFLDIAKELKFTLDFEGIYYLTKLVKEGKTFAGPDNAARYFLSLYIDEELDKIKHQAVFDTDGDGLKFVSYIIEKLKTDNKKLDLTHLKMLRLMNFDRYKNKKRVNTGRMYISKSAFESLKPFISDNDVDPNFVLELLEISTPVVMIEELKFFKGKLRKKDENHKLSDKNKSDLLDYVFETVSSMKLHDDKSYFNDFINELVELGYIENNLAEKYVIADGTKVDNHQEQEQKIDKNKTEVNSKDRQLHNEDDTEKYDETKYETEVRSENEKQKNNDNNLNKINEGNKPSVLNQNDNFDYDLDKLLEMSKTIDELESNLIKVKDKKVIFDESRKHLDGVFNNNKSDRVIFKKLGDNEKDIDRNLDKIKREIIICIAYSNMSRDHKSNYIKLVKNANNISVLRRIWQTIKNIIKFRFSEVGKAKQSIIFERINNIRDKVNKDNQI